MKPAFIYLASFDDTSGFSCAFPSIRGNDDVFTSSTFSAVTARLNSVDSTTFSRGSTNDNGYQWFAVAIAETPNRIVSSTQNGNGSGNIYIDFGFQPTMVIAKSVGDIATTLDGMSSVMADSLLLLSRTDGNTGYVNYYCLTSDQNVNTSTAIQILSLIHI